MKKFSELEISDFEQKDNDGKRILEGELVGITSLLNMELEFLDIEENVTSKFDTGKGKETVVVQMRDPIKGDLYKMMTSNNKLVHIFKECHEKEYYPFTGTIRSRVIKGKSFQEYYLE